jgi:hypothetical protein
MYTAVAALGQVRKRTDGSGTWVTVHNPPATMDVNATELRAYDFSNATIRIDVIEGDGSIVATGQTASNASDDAAAPIAVQVQ